jgi:hypothetical protein
MTSRGVLASSRGVHQTVMGLHESMIPRVLTSVLSSHHEA